MDKVQKIREEVKMVVNRRLNLLNGDYFDLNKEADGFTNEIMDIIDPLKEEHVSDELEKVVEEIVDPTVLNAYGVKEIANRLRRTMIEPVSEELEVASKEWLRPQLDKSYANYGEGKMMELTHFDGYAMLDAIEFGAKWQKAKDESTIELAEDNAYFVGRTKTIDEINEALLSEVLPCFMHGGEADEVVAKLDEVLNQK